MGDSIGLKASLRKVNGFLVITMPEQSLFRCTTKGVAKNKNSFWSEGFSPTDHHLKLTSPTLIIVCEKNHAQVKKIREKLINTQTNRPEGLTPEGKWLFGYQNASTIVISLLDKRSR